MGAPTDPFPLVPPRRPFFPVFLRQEGDKPPDKFDGRCGHL